MSVRLDGRTAVVTGASAGVGAAAARQLAELGATVAVVGRSPEKTAAVAEKIGADWYTVDYSRLDEVHKLAATLSEKYPTIDILANNAGGQFLQRAASKDGHELTFQVNYLAPFLLTHLLMGSLTAAADARVISTSSGAYSFAGRMDLDDLSNTGRRFSSVRFYAASKLGNILFTRELARRAQGTSVTASAFHPGAVASDIFRDGGWMGALMESPLGRRLQISPDQGAAPLVHLATVADAQSVNGAYFNRMKRAEVKGRAFSDPDFGRRLWDRTAELAGVTADL